jgi:hypothetical protein
MKSTQAMRILRALKEAGSGGCHPKVFIMDLKIWQYNARIYDLREQFDCHCKHSSICFAKEHIKNKTLSNGTTKFFYVDDTEKLNQQMKQYQEEDLRDDKSQSELF